MASALDNLLFLWEISGCPVAPLLSRCTAAAPAPSAWVADPPYGFSFFKRFRIVMTGAFHSWAIETRLLLAFDLNHFRVVNDDFDGTEPNPLDREQNRLLDCPIA
jgi:hypothetical protein